MAEVLKYCWREVVLFSMLYQLNQVILFTVMIWGRHFEFNHLLYWCSGHCFFTRHQIKRTKLLFFFWPRERSLRKKHPFFLNNISNRHTQIFLSSVVKCFSFVCMYYRVFSTNTCYFLFSLFVLRFIEGKNDLWIYIEDIPDTNWTRK